MCMPVYACMPVVVKLESADLPGARWLVENENFEQCKRNIEVKMFNCNFLTHFVRLVRQYEINTFLTISSPSKISVASKK